MDHFICVPDDHHLTNPELGASYGNSKVAHVHVGVSIHPNLHYIIITALVPSYLTRVPFGLVEWIRLATHVSPIIP